MLPNDAVDLLSTLTPGQPMNIRKEILNCIFSTSRPPGGVSCTWTSRCVRHGEFGNKSVTLMACFHTRPTRETEPKHKRATDLHQSARSLADTSITQHQSLHHRRKENFNVRCVKIRTQSALTVNVTASLNNRYPVAAIASPEGRR